MTRKRILHQLKQSTRKAGEALARLDERDPEALHDLRVGVRVADSTLRPLLTLPGMKPVKRRMKKLKALSAAQNPVRDREAQLELLSRLVPGPYPAPVAAWLTRARAGLEIRRQGLSDASGLAEVPERMARLRRLGKRRLASFKGGRLRRTLARACRALQSELYEDSCGGRELFDDADALHQTRIKAKRLRYLLECYPHLQIDDGALHDAAKAAQDALGDLRDWRALLRQVARVPVMDAWLDRQGRIDASLLAAAVEALAGLGERIAAGRSGERRKG